MIIVTGATGRLGARIVDRLLERVPADTVGVSVRDVAKAAHLAERGVRVRAGDFTDRAELDHALQGADQVLVVSPSIRDPREFVRATRAGLDAAVRSGARRVLYTSHQMASPSSSFTPGRNHAESEAYLAERASAHGVAWTSLRHGFYAGAFELFVPAALRSGELRLPADGPVSWTAHDDLAEAAAAVLTEHRELSGATSPLVGPELLDFADVARIVSEQTGSPVERVVVDDDAWKAEAVDGGMPESVAEFTLGMFRASRAGENAVTDPALQTLIGRAATPARTVLAGILSWALPVSRHR
ncbi:NmrA family NAD(P)-binding protein [Antribacter sp. KLBMP9083]|uniref:NmrA family NAD(P)-binding protein n=1 Tax=Antribacter soli TaxID=2910976 RepID=A0AA41QCX3_9MICO|nr:NmrA family NAD(P)-binding protein [Antribacter soli]MCF4121143.1 NmrA family NAD(P)-binding protein [Antribacter soli]